MDKRPEDFDRLLQLPQESDVWQFGYLQWPDWIAFVAKLWQPWLFIAYSLTHRKVVTDFPFCLDPPNKDFVWRIFWRAVVCPARPATPHRPTELQLRDDAIGHALKPWIEQLGITCVLKCKMEAVEKALHESGEAYYGPSIAEP